MSVYPILLQLLLLWVEVFLLVGMLGKSVIYRVRF